MSTVVNVKIKHKRGTEDSIPTLLEGQLYLCTDTNKIFKGTSTGDNICIGDIEKLNNVESAKVNKSDIVNDCNTDNTNKILGADQGKYLKDYIDNINAKTLCNLQRENDNLGLEQVASAGWHIIKTNVNGPEANGEYVVEVINPYPSNNSFIIQHIYSLWTNKIYMRFYTNGTGVWSDYKTLL